MIDDIRRDCFPSIIKKSLFFTLPTLRLEMKVLNLMSISYDIYHLIISLHIGYDDTSSLIVQVSHTYVIIMKVFSENKIEKKVEI